MRQLGSNNETNVRDTGDTTMATIQRRGQVDAVLKELETAWNALARYTVYRSEFSPVNGTRRQKLYSGKTLVEARALQITEGRALQQEPDYREGRMTTPLIGIELEDAEQTTARFRSRHQIEHKMAA